MRLVDDFLTDEAEGEGVEPKRTFDGIVPEGFADTMAVAAAAFAKAAATARASTPAASNQLVYSDEPAVLGDSGRAFNGVTQPMRASTPGAAN